jgi:hypothetical protein
MGEVIPFARPSKRPQTFSGTGLPPLLAHGRDAGSICDVPRLGTCRANAAHGPDFWDQRHALIDFAKQGAPPKRPHHLELV